MTTGSSGGGPDRRQRRGPCLTRVSVGALPEGDPGRPCVGGVLQAS